MWYIVFILGGTVYGAVARTHSARPILEFRSTENYGTREWVAWKSEESARNIISDFFPHRKDVFPIFCAGQPEVLDVIEKWVRARHAAKKGQKE